MGDLWVVYDASTGDIKWIGRGPEGFGAQQVAPSGMAVLVNPDDRSVACGMHRVDLVDLSVVAVD